MPPPHQCGAMKTARLQDWPTRRFVWPALSIVLVAWVIDTVNLPLKVHFGVPYLPLEYLSAGMSMLGWGFLLLLLPVAAFRPEARFYLKGDCARRAKTFGFVLAANFAIFTLLLISSIVAWS